MESKFNLYDLLGFAVPGTLLAAILYGAGREFDLIPVANLTLATSFVFIAAAYVLGHLMLHGTRDWIRTTYYSKSMLDDGDPKLGADFIPLLRKAITERFKLEFPAPRDGKLVAGESLNQTAFDLCYAYVIQRGKGGYTENFNSLYGMCRNMRVVAVFAMLYACAVIAHRTFFPLCGALLVMGLLLAVGGWVDRQFSKGMKTYSERFALSVYRTFYGLHVGPSEK